MWIFGLLFRVGMDSPLIESLNMNSSIFLLVTLMTLLPSSTGGLMGLWEEQPVSLSFKGLDVIWMIVPSFHVGGALAPPTAPQMRDVVSNR